jgi:hypothetical protein
LPVAAILPRGPRLDAAREEIVRRLGDDEARRLLADGAATGVDDPLAKIAGWLKVD